MALPPMSDHLPPALLEACVVLGASYDKLKELYQMFSLHPLNIVLPSREDMDCPTVDLDLQIPLLCFRPQRVLQPMSWQQLYVPVLASGMLALLMAPTAFLMGCHSSHYKDVAALVTWLVDSLLLEERQLAELRPELKRLILKFIQGDCAELQEGCFGEE
ncbi:unnamed protein product [Lota lota]